MVVLTLGAILLSHPISEPVKQTICSYDVLQYNEAVSGFEDMQVDVLEPTNSGQVPPEPALQCSTDREIFLKLIQGRRELVQERCKSLKQYKQQYAPREKWFLDKTGTKGVVWCPIFKAASTFTEAHFCPRYFSDEICDGHIAAGNWRTKGFDKKKAPAGTPKLLTVRNPFDRVLSAYRDKIEALRPQNPYRGPIFNEIVRHHRFISFEDRNNRDKLLNEAREMSKTGPYERGVSVYVKGSTNPYLNPISATFPEFIKNLLTDHWRNEHWAEMTERCAPCTMDYEFILKTEDYACEFPMFLDAIGASSIKFDNTKPSNGNDARKDSRYADVFEYYGQLPDDTIDAFVRWFKDDCYLFDYDCEKLAREIKEWKSRNNRNKL